MQHESLGHLYALLAAITWAFALILFKRSGEHLSPLALNMFKNVVGIILLGATLALTGQGLSTIAQFPIEDVAILVISGILGIAIADTIQLYALNTVGVGTISIVDCTYSPFAILLGWWMLGETLTVGDWVGIILIVSGVLLAVQRDSTSGRTLLETVLGVAAATLAIALMVIGIVFAKPVLTVDGFPLLWATFLRLSLGTLVLAVVAAASPNRRRVWSCFRPSGVWWFSVPAAFFGAYLAMMFWVGGFKYAKVANAAILNQTSVIFAIVLATIVLKERFDRRRLLAVIAALTGTVLVTWDPSWSEALGLGGA